MTDKSKRFLAVLGVLAMTGCGVFGGGSAVPSTAYKAQICADGVVVVPCKDLGTVKVPDGAEGLVSVVLAIAAPELTKTANLKNCKFQTYPPVVDENGYAVTATAVCDLNGVPVSENLTVKLTK